MGVGQQLLRAWRAEHDWHAIACLYRRLNHIYWQAVQLRVPVNSRSCNQQAD